MSRVVADLGDALRAATPDPDALDLGAVHARRDQLERRARAGRLVAGGAVLAVALAGGAVLLRDPPPQDRLVAAPPASTAPVVPSPTGPPSPSGTRPVPPPPATGPEGSTVTPATPPPVTSPRPTAPVTRAPSPSATAAAPPFGGQTTPSTGDSSPGQVTLVAVRAAHQPGFDRVVYEFAGDGQPGWRVRYDDRPTLDGSGDPVEVAGGAALAVVMTGISWTEPVPGAVEYSGGRLAPSGTSLVREVVPGVLFEGEQQSWIGLDRQVPYRVTRLTGPTRLVVDVATG